MSLPLKDPRKHSTGINYERRKLTTRDTSDKLFVHETANTMKKSDHRKSDADMQEKKNTQASTEPYVYECKDFAGVTIIFRTAPNPKSFGNAEGRGRNGLHDNRRRSDFQQTHLNSQERFDYEEKIDHIGASASVSATKSNGLSNNSNEASNNDNEH